MAVKTERDRLWSDIFRAHTFGFKESKWNYGCYKQKLVSYSCLAVSVCI